MRYPGEIPFRLILPLSAREIEPLRKCKLGDNFLIFLHYFKSVNTLCESITKKRKRIRFLDEKKQPPAYIPRPLTENEKELIKIENEISVDIESLFLYSKILTDWLVRTIKIVFSQQEIREISFIGFHKFLNSLKESQSLKEFKAFFLSDLQWIDDRIIFVRDEFIVHSVETEPLQRHPGRQIYGWLIDISFYPQNASEKHFKYYEEKMKILIPKVNKDTNSSIVLEPDIRRTAERFFAILPEIKDDSLREDVKKVIKHVAVRTPNLQSTVNRFDKILSDILRYCHAKIKKIPYGKIAS